MIGVMSPHLIIAPVLLPVLTAALMLALKYRPSGVRWISALPLVMAAMR